MADPRAELADKCVDWIIKSTRKETREKLKLIDNLTSKVSPLTEEEKSLLNTLQLECKFERPDLSCDEAVISQYTDYWFDLLTNAFKTTGKKYTIAPITEDGINRTLLKRIKHQDDKKPILFYLEFMDDDGSGEQHFRIVMLKSSVIGIQFVQIPN